MSDNLKIILSEYEKLKGQLVLHDYKVYRLIAIGEDDMDYYYVLWDGRKVLWASCVCGLIQLKGKLDDKDYESLVRVIKLNDVTQPTIYPDDPLTEELNLSEKNKVEDIELPNKFLTEVFWDII